MKRIHWKLSARSEGYFTKILESPKQSSFSVILDFGAPSYEAEELMDLNDCLIETAFALIDHLAQNEMPWTFTYTDRGHRPVQRLAPGDVSKALIRDFELIHDAGSAGPVSGAQLVYEDGIAADCSSNLIVCTADPSPALIQELVGQKQEQRQPELFLIILEGLNSREREKLLTPLMTLDDAGIPYHVLTTKLNLRDPGGGEQDA